MHPREGASTAGGFASGWNRFWYAEGNPLTLGVFRALFALCLAIELPAIRNGSLFAVEGGFHIPYLGFLPPASSGTYALLHDLQYPFILLLGLGLLPRLSAAVLLGLSGYVFFADWLNFRNHPYFFLIILFLLIFAPAGKAFSVPSLVRGLIREARTGQANGEVRAPLTIQRLLQVQVSLVYFYAALHKMSAEFLSGQVLADIMGGSVANGRIGELLTALVSPASLERLRSATGLPGFWVVPSWITVILEAALPFALWSPRFRKAAMLFGIPFHLAIGYTMKIEIFSAAMISSYLLFLDPETLPRLWGRIRGPGKARAPVKAPARRKGARR